MKLNAIELVTMFEKVNFGTFKLRLQYLKRLIFCVNVFSFLFYDIVIRNYYRLLTPVIGLNLNEYKYIFVNDSKWPYSLSYRGFEQL